MKAASANIFFSKSTVAAKYIYVKHVHIHISLNNNRIILNQHTCYFIGMDDAHRFEEGLLHLCRCGGQCQGHRDDGSGRTQVWAEQDVQQRKQFRKGSLLGGSGRSAPVKDGLLNLALIMI
jgi:hypothetical protein